MKNDYTHVSILIDRSGSMQSIKSDVIGGFNQLIDDQKLVPGELTITLAQFDQNNGLQYDLINNFSPLKEVISLTNENYVPRGSTPLNDALAKLINDTGKVLADKPEQDRPSKVLIVSITDGRENASKEHTKESLKALIENQEKNYNWQFMYIGANQDTFAESASRGITANYAFTSDSFGTKKMSKVMSSTIASYRSSDPSMSYNLSDELNKEAKKADLEDSKK